MKKILTLILIIATTYSAIGQNRRDDRLKEKNNEKADELFVDEESDKDFNNYSIPDSFKTAPAIIISKKTTYTFPISILMPVSTKTHYKILLNEKTAVEEYSTLYFDLKLKESDQIAIRILKKDGTINKITGTNDAITVDKGNVPKIYRNYGNTTNVKYYKLAIPNLEIGDTLEYITLQNRINGGLYTSYSRVTEVTPFEPIYYFSNSQYPIITQKLIFDLSKQHFLTAKSMLGASTLKPYEVDSRRARGYVFMEKNKNSVEDAKWLYDARELPHIKFQVLFGVKGRNGDKSRYFISEDADEIKSSITQDDMESKFNRIIVNGSTYQLVTAEVMNKMKKNYRNEERNDILVELIYNHLRSLMHNSNGVMNDEAFASLFVYYASKYDVPVNIIAAPSRKTSTIDNMLLADEILYCINYKNKFIFAPSINSKIYDINKNVEGQIGYVAKLERNNSRILSINSISLPSSNFSNNTEDTKIYLSIDENFENLKFIDTTYYKGQFRVEYENFFEKLDEMRVQEDKKNLFLDDEDEKERGNTARIEEKKRKEEEAKKQLYQKYVDNELKKDLENNFPKIINIDTFQILSTGTLEKDSVLIDKREIVIGDLIKKIGNNYIVEIGKAIGSQVEIKKDERIRKGNVWFEFPKTLSNTIKMKIPEGYQAEGLENFNFNVTNNAGEFVSKAIIENGYVIINTSKIYKQNYLPSSEWNNMVDVLDAAFNFTQKQLILKK